MPRFCTALHQGRPCTRRALPGQLFCYGHHPNPVESRRCEYFNRKGQPCRSTTLRGQSHCFTHSPRNRRAKHPATPLIPRTRRQKAQAKWLTFINMPQSKTALLELLSDQGLAGAP
jgi:hypothetical protein